MPVSITRTSMADARSPKPKPKAKPKPKPTLFTMTSFLERDDKLRQAINALRSIQKHEPRLSDSCTFLLVNDCSTRDVSFLLDEFDFIDEIVQNTNSGGPKRTPSSTATSTSSTGCGQAASLNIIVDRLRAGKFSYWLHWEESWVAQRPFLELCYEAMKAGIKQMQLTTDTVWRGNSGVNRNLSKGGKVTRLQPRKSNDVVTQSKDSFRRSHPGGRPGWEESFASCARPKDAMWRRDYVPDGDCRDPGGMPGVYWPLWSLRPGMDVASRVCQVGYFTESPLFWPIHFELEWAYRWAMLPGAVKAGKTCAIRQPGHVSFSETHFLS